MKKVLIITYFWPPAGGPGIQRPLKFCKYLPEFDWQPIVLTVKDGEFQAIDKSLEVDIPKSTSVYKTRKYEPYNIYKKFVGMSSDEQVPVDAITEKNIGLAKKISFWIRANLFIPDAMIGWYPFAVKQGKKIIKKHNIDIIFSTSPHQTAHLIAKKLSKWSGLKWVADFRDPWTNIHFLSDLKRFPISQKIDCSMEKSVLESAHAITSVTEYDIREDYSNKVSNKDKFYYIPNGYDEDDYSKYFKDELINTKDKKFNIVYLGTVGEERIPLGLFKAVKLLDHNNIIHPEKFCITFVGHVEPATIESYKAQQIEKYIKLISYIPHSEVFKYLRKATVLLLLIYNAKNNMGHVPGKLYEYLRACKPILTFGPEEGEVADILTKTKRGEVIAYKNIDKTYNTLINFIHDFNLGNKKFSKCLKNLEMYNRKFQTEKLVEIFISLTK